MSGLPAITAGMGDATYGFRVVGIVRLIHTKCGLHIAGNIGMAAGCWLRGTGARLKLIQIQEESGASASLFFLA